MFTAACIMQLLEKAGVVPGADLTTEAALTKLSYVLGRKDLTTDQRKLVSRLLIGQFTF